MLQVPEPDIDQFADTLASETSKSRFIAGLPSVYVKDEVTSVGAVIDAPEQRFAPLTEKGKDVF